MSHFSNRKIDQTKSQKQVKTEMGDGKGDTETPQISKGISYRLLLSYDLEYKIYEPKEHIYNR